ncbi:MAG: tetratricopeptide repeat protein [Deltaproteobacteria bacterium]|nr:tetratricopeptide repeat protein [Deltaproteobacteria bacterium]
MLQALCDKSLVARRADGRLGLLEAIREHASEQARDPGTELRLARHFASRAKRAVEEVGSTRARVALGWLRSELENLLGVLDALIDAGHLDDEAASDTDARDSAAWLVLGIDAILQRVGPSSMHASRLDRVLARPLSPALEVPLRLARARIHRDAGAMESGEAEIARAIEIAPPKERAGVRAELGEARLARGAIDEAESTLREAHEEARVSGTLLGEQKAAARLGLALHARGRLDDAQGFYEQALDLASRLASPALEAVAHRDLGSLLLQRGYFARARAHYAEALARTPHDDLRLEGIVRGNLGIIALEEGELEVATTSFRRALECLRRIGDRTFEAHLLVYAGLTQFERGSPAEAREAYASAIDTLAEVGDARMEGIARAARAVAVAALGEDGAPENDLAVATRRLAGVEDPALLALLDVSRAHVAMLGAHGAIEARQEAVRVAQETEALARVSDDLRFARRALVRALPAERFVFSPAGGGFVAPDGARIDLSRRATLARLLDALVQKRLAQPGVAASFDELIAAGWPGERVLPLAAQNRLRVAMTTLRNMGLRQVLVFRDGGHLLDPDVPAVIAA